MDNVLDMLIQDPTDTVQYGPYLYKVLGDEVYYCPDWPDRRDKIWYKHNQLTSDYNFL